MLAFRDIIYMALQDLMASSWNHNHTVIIAPQHQGIHPNPGIRIVQDGCPSRRILAYGLSQLGQVRPYPGSYLAEPAASPPRAVHSGPLAVLWIYMG